ncbi:MAG: hypothetical protein ABI970_16445, partial [Chloroflexota bacterium]
LPPTLSRLAPYLTGEDAGMAPSGLLLSAASDFGDEWRDPVLIRLAESSIRAKRSDIVDTQALGGMVGLIGTTWGVQYSQTLNWIAIMLCRDETLTRLELPGPTYLLRLLLASGGYKDAANEMLHQARVLYPGEAQADYITMVQRLFAETPIPIQQMPHALKALNEAGVKSLPLLMAYIGILEAHSWSSALDRIAQQATVMLLENSDIAKVIPAPAMIALLKFHINRKDVDQTIRVASIMPQVAIREGARGINLIGRMYKLMDWDEKIRIAALELLRRYVRIAPDAEARKAITAFGREFGAGIQQATETSYAIRRMLDNLELIEYADFLHSSAEYLYDTALTYVDKAKVPTIGSVMNSLDSLGGSLSSSDRILLANELSEVGKAILELGKPWQSHARELDQHIENLLQGRKDPTCALDVFWIIAGYLARGKRQPLKMQRILSQHIFGERTAPRVLDETRIVGAVLQSALQAFPPTRKITISAEAIRQEMDSLWGDIPLEKQREIVREFTTDLQRVGELSYLIASTGNPKAMEDGSFARKLEESSQQPKSTLEMYRFVSGYFRARS